MNKVRETIVDVAAPVDKNVIWVDISGEQPIQKVFLNGDWQNLSGGSVPTNVMTKISNPHSGKILLTDDTGQAVESNKDVSSFLATPAVTGNQGEVLTADENGNPIWNTFTPTGSADLAMSDSSTNAVQNKVIKAYVDDNCAKKDGYYSTLTVGAAETLVGETVDSEAYLIRPTGGESNEVANGVASVLGMEGHTVKFNQLDNPPKNNTSIDGLTVTWVNDHYHIQGTSTYSTNYTNLEVLVGGNLLSKTFTGHTYYMRGIRNSNSNVSIAPLVGNGANFNNPVVRVTSGAYIFVASDAIKSEFLYHNKLAVDVDYYPVCIDLTAMFGTDAEIAAALGINVADITTSTGVAAFEAWLAKNVGLKPYYGYNAGTILSAQTLGIKTYGQNLLNPTTRQAKLIPYEWEDNSNVYTIKNVPSGATATFTPDATGVAETVDISGGSLDITSYGSGILELSAATADTYVCMKWDEDKDDDVVPYEDHTQNFDVRKVYGKVNGAGEYVQCYPNGLMGIGNVKDSLTAAGATKVIGDVDWDTIGMFYQYGHFYLDTNAKIPTSTAVAGNAISSLYVIYPYNDIQTSSVVIGVGINSTGNVVINNNNYTDAATFKAAMSGVMLYYELETPITYTDLVYRDGGIDRPLTDVLFNIEVNNWSIEEQLLTPYVDGSPTAVPAKISTQYGMDAVEEIDTIKHTYVSAYSEQNFSDSQKAQARRNIGAVEEDGSYPNMSVGIAKNLAGENAVEAEYTYRPSNGTIGTNTGIANITAVKGKTLKWNQKLPNSATSRTYDFGSLSKNGEITLIVSTSPEADYVITNLSDVNFNKLSGHKYLWKCSDSRFKINDTWIWGAEATKYTDSSFITTAGSSSNSQVGIKVPASIATGTYKFGIVVIDLTDLFGEGNEPSTVEEFEALYPLDYYAYTATPILINNAASGIVTTGFNQWDEEWEVGNINTTTGEPKSGTGAIRAKNYNPCFGGQTYNAKLPSGVTAIRLYYYDASKNYISASLYPDGNLQQVIPQNACYFKLVAGVSTYANDICINLSDTAKNGTYEPYEKHTFYFDKVLQGEGSLATIKGKLNGEGESVVVFPDGLKRAGNAYDEIKGNVAIKRVGSVDLGDLTTTYDNTYFVVNLAVNAKFLGNNVIPNIISPLYSPIGIGDLNSDINMRVAVRNTGTQLYIRNSSYSDAASFKTAMSGVILYYELATPETYILDQTVTGGYQVNALGTEQRIPEDTASAVNAPVSYSVIYPIDAVGTITKLPVNYISEGSLTNFTTELASKLGTFLSATIGISATYNQTTQEYDFSITITQN